MSAVVTTRPRRWLAALLLAASSALAAVAQAQDDSRANALTLDEVLASARTHFPAVQAAVQETLIKDGKALAAMGAFDLSMKQESLAWTSGYYEGLSVDTKIVKPLPQANMKFFGGYRLSNDDFPIYQQELVTNQGGEYNLGVMFSLMRDRAIDKRRFGVAAAELEREAAQLELALARIMTQRNAARAYFRWLAAGQQLAVYRRLTTLAEGRMSGLDRRAEAGDVARIFVVENRQNLLRRQALLTEAERRFRAAAIDLSLYYRDDASHPLEPDPTRLPETFPELLPLLPTEAAMVDQAIAARPELYLLDNASDAEQQRLALARNELLPRVDVGIKAAQDIGSGSITREGFDTILNVTVDVPLERRFGRGKVAEAEARLEQLRFERQLAEDRIATEIRKLANSMGAAEKNVSITGEESEQALIMEDAERTRFRAGASDFFVVNLREERTADARVRNIDALLGYFENLTDYYATTVDLSALGIAKEDLAR